MEAKVRALAMVGTELRKAIASSQLFLVYQPQIDVDTGQIVSVEALVRWCHPERGASHDPDGSESGWGRSWLTAVNATAGIVRRIA